MDTYIQKFIYTDIYTFFWRDSRERNLMIPETFLKLDDERRIQYGISFHLKLCRISEAWPGCSASDPCYVSTTSTCCNTGYATDILYGSYFFGPNIICINTYTFTQFFFLFSPCYKSISKLWFDYIIFLESLA